MHDMGADGVAAWLGASIIAVLSFAPAIMAPTREAREWSGSVARLSLPAAALAALWTTLSVFELTPPPGGVLLWVLYPPLLALVGLATWGLGLLARWTAHYWLGWRIPSTAAALLGVGSVALALVVR